MNGHDGGLINLFRVADWGWRSGGGGGLVFLALDCLRKWTVTAAPACRLGLPLPSGFGDLLVAAQRGSCLS